MRWLIPAKLHVLVGILLAVDARSALAAGVACPRMSVEVDAEVRERWPELSEGLRRAFSARDDIDLCACVALAMRDGKVAVEVVLPDGRSAARFVSRREDVVPTLEALLLLPRRPPRPPAPAAPAPIPQTRTGRAPEAPRLRAVGTHDVKDAKEVPGHDHPVVPDRTASDAPGRAGVELSVAAGARIGDGQVSVGVGAISLLDVAGWLAGFGGRVDRIQGLAEGSPRAALELAALGGRRFRLRTLSLDLAVGPALALQGTFTRETGPSGQRSSESSTVPRLLLSSRLSFRADSAVRTFVGLDGVVGPARALAADPSSEAPPLPVWTVGLALGATVGAR